MKIYAELLNQLTETLIRGGQIPEIIDDFHTYHLKIGIDLDTLTLLPKNLLEDAIGHFGTALRLGLGAIHSDVPVTVYSYADIVDYIRDYDVEVSNAFFITVNKTVLLQREFPVQSAQVIWFTSSEMFAAECSQSLAHLCTAWFAKCQRIVFLVENPGCRMEGKWLSILGTDLAPNILRQQIEELRTEEDCTQLSGRSKQRSMETRWLGGVHGLFPENLFCTPGSGSRRHPAIEGLIFKHCMDLIVCSLANVSEPDPEEEQGVAWVARFEGQKQVTVGTNGLTTVTFEDCQVWFDLYSWVYNSSKITEAMGILRNLLTLQPYDQATRNYSLLASWGNELTRSVNSHYTKFVSTSVEQYFAKLKESSAFFQGKVDSLSKQIGDLIDAFIKNLLAVFGVVTGTVLVKALDKTSQTQGLLPFLFFAFSTYVAMVAVSYYVVSWKSYLLTKAEYQKNLEVAKSFFTEEDTKKYVGNAFSDRETLFLQTFKWTAGIYIFMFACGIIGFFLTITKSPLPVSNDATVSASPLVSIPAKATSSPPTKHVGRSHPHL